MVILELRDLAQILDLKVNSVQREFTSIADRLSTLRRKWSEVEEPERPAIIAEQETLKEKQILVAATAIVQAEENFRINTERYREQVGTSTEVIDAQTLLTKARSDRHNALGDFNISRARLERATGVSAPE